MVDFHKRILFTDEVHFWLNGYVNKQNCRIWSKANPQVYGFMGWWNPSSKTMKTTTLQSMSLVYADKPQTLDHLEDNIRRVIADIRPQMLEKVIENWTSRLDYIRASRGSPMPEIIFKIQPKRKLLNNVTRENMGSKIKGQVTAAQGYPTASTELSQSKIAILEELCPTSTQKNNLRKSWKTREKEKDISGRMKIFLEKKLGSTGPWRMFRSSSCAHYAEHICVSWPLGTIDNRSDVLRISSPLQYHFQSSSLQHSHISALDAAIAGNSSGTRFLEVPLGDFPFLPEPLRQSYRRAFGDGPHNFEPWSSDVDGI
ncbi:uncharacterized protein TNCV_2785531 [Trichonephila clavipes]|nr:uncharacterized protein TNCV_2785531 [Trichonephila clavipes]